MTAGRLGLAALLFSCALFFAVPQVYRAMHGDDLTLEVVLPCCFLFGVSVWLASLN